jgi:hypothetical protein
VVAHPAEQLRELLLWLAIGKDHAALFLAGGPAKVPEGDCVFESLDQGLPSLFEGVVTSAFSLLIYNHVDQVRIRQSRQLIRKVTEYGQAVMLGNARQLL